MSETYAPGSTHPDLTALFAERAARTPDALALTDGEDSCLTYRQLDCAAADLAVRLVVGGVRPGEAVALLVRRSIRTVVAQLALWRAGAVCVPLDPAHPRARTEAVLADSGAVLTVGDGDLLEAAGVSGPRLVLEADAPASASAGVTALPGPGPDATAFIMFTSGSTGQPKGVAVRHRAVASLVTDPSYVTVGARDRVLLHSPATFDASTFEVWVALANGAAVVVCPADRPSFEDLARTVERQSVTVAFFTTALFHQLAARRSRVFGLLRSVVVGGEALSVRHAGVVLDAYPWLELVNGYGPTETTTFATAHRVTEADLKGPMPVGRPIAGASAHVLGADGGPVAEGEVGELWIGGGRLAAGYVGRPGLTAERFVEHPALGRLYRTGDLASVRADGVLDFHGRTDDQVKVRGHRIEPGEIEHALRDLPEVEDAAVTVRRATPDDARLTAFAVLTPGTASDAATVRSRLAERLPAYLVPDELTVVHRLPLSGAGKVDRGVLAEWGAGAGAPGGAGAGAPGGAGAGAPGGTGADQPDGTGAGAPDGTSAGEPGDAGTGAPYSAPGAVATSPHSTGTAVGPVSGEAGPVPGGPGPVHGEARPMPGGPGLAPGEAGPVSGGPGPVPDEAGPMSGGPGPVPDEAGPMSGGPGPVPGEAGPVSGEADPAPGRLTPLQAVVAEVWGRSLGCEVRSADDDFLALGGHSLLALAVADDLREDLGVELSLAEFFALPTVAGHAALVERALLAAHGDPRPSADAPALPLTSHDAPEHHDVP